MMFKLNADETKLNSNKKFRVLARPGHAAVMPEQQQPHIIAVVIIRADGTLKPCII